MYLFLKRKTKRMVIRPFSATSWKTCFFAKKWVQVTPSGLFFSKGRKNTPSNRPSTPKWTQVMRDQTWESTITWFWWHKVNRVKLSDTRVTPSDTKWNWVRSKWNRVTPSEIEWHQVTPSETEWHWVMWHPVQVKPSDIKWYQVTPSELEWHQMKLSDAKCIL